MCWCWDLLGRRTNGDKYRLLFGAEQGVGLGFSQSESEARRCRILQSSVVNTAAVFFPADQA